MGDIVNIQNYIRRTTKKMEPQEIEQNISNRNQNGDPICLAEIRDFANLILESTENYSGRCATPIVRIAKMFGFGIYKTKLKSSQSGRIEVNGDTRDRYGTDKVILLNENENLSHLRFVIAHELAHYFFEFLGNDRYRNPEEKFCSLYNKDEHATSEEATANAFAAEILMPRDLFEKQYNVAKQEGFSRGLILEYLSRYFELSIDSIRRRIVEVFE